ACVIAADPADGRALRCARRADATVARRQGAPDSAVAQADNAAHHAQPHRSSAAFRSHHRDDVPAGPRQTHRRDRAAATANIGSRVEHDVRSPRCGNLERSARGGEPRHARRRAAFARGRQVNAVARWGPPALGLGTLVAAGAILEALIRGGAVNRYIVPLPSQVVLAFERVIVEENVVHRFLLTTAETLVAGALITVVGVAFGVLLHRVRLIRAACETWVAAFASAP